MLKLTIAVLAVALAGSASAAGWRSLRVDGSSEAGFTRSVAQFKARLSPARRQVFFLALEDVWEQGVKNAEARQSEYTRNDYLLELNGLAYKHVVTLTDPTGDTAKLRLRTAIASVYGRLPAGFGRAPPAWAQNSQRSYPARDPAGNPNGEQLPANR